MNGSYQNAAPEFYSHSGRFSPLVVLTFPIVFVASIFMAFVYNWMVIYIPIIGYFSILLTFGYAVIIGLTVAFCLTLFKVRNIWVSRLTGIFCGSLALYLAWVVFIYLFMGKFSPKSEVTLLAALFSPLGIWDVACAIAEKGWYTISSATPSGWVLWTFWAIEALIIQITIFLCSEGSVGSSVFCEECGEWTESADGTVNFILDDDENLVEMFMNRDFSFLTNAVRAKSTETDFYRIDSSICSICQNFFVVSLLHVTKTYDKDENENVNENDLVTRMIVQPDEFEQLLEMRKVLHGSKAPTEPASTEGEPETLNIADPKVIEIMDAP